MYKHNNIQIDKLLILITLILILVDGSVKAQEQNPQFVKIVPSVEETQSTDYWTPERMKNAIPMPLPKIVPDSEFGSKVELNSEPELPLNTQLGSASDRAVQLNSDSDLNNLPPNIQNKEK